MMSENNTAFPSTSLTYYNYVLLFETLDVKRKGTNQAQS